MINRVNFLVLWLACSHLCQIIRIDAVNSEIKSQLKSDAPGARELPHHGSLDESCENVLCCIMSDKERCPLSNMPKDETALIYPGGETRCIFSYSRPYAFQIIRGASDKVLFHFQGGGACIDESTTNTGGFCSINIKPEGHRGIFERGPKSNSKFKEYTIINILYCSGDSHLGNHTLSYNDRAGFPILYRGALNALTAIEWALDQQRIGRAGRNGLDAQLVELLITGASAGSVGAQLVGMKRILQGMRWSRAAVLLDSGFNVYPRIAFGKVLEHFGYCSVGLISNPGLVDKCYRGEALMTDLLVEFANIFPTVPLAYVQSKSDAGLQKAYEIAARVYGDEGAELSPAEFYEEVNELIVEYHARLGNFVTYLVNGQNHVFTVNQFLATADASGPLNRGAGFSGMPLLEWVEQFPLLDGQQVDSVCEGKVRTTSGTNLSEDKGTHSSEVDADVRAKASANIDAGKESVADSTYCLAEVFEVTFTQHHI